MHGVNQTLHRIYLELEAKVGILTPMGSFSESSNYTALLTEAVIVGEIPETYYNLEGLNKQDTLNILE